MRVSPPLGLGLLGLLLFPVTGSGQAPPGYYDSALGLTGPSLRNALHNIVDDHTVIPYSGAGFDTHDAIDLIQEDPQNSSNVILIYSGFSVPKSSWPDYNREHVWPSSLGAAQGSPAYSDIFNLYGCDTDVNAQRGNRYFRECLSSCEVPAEAPLCLYDDESWEPRDVDKGDLARALFYMDVRYSGDTGNEPDLVLDDMATTLGCDCMGLLIVLLDWHAQDPPDAAEVTRNNVIFDDVQGNRNPFVDHPEFVSALWGGAPPGGSGEVWINEIHYDNVGGDVGEGVEIAGEAGTSLAGWTVVAYNGSVGTAYDTIALFGTVPDEGAGFGAVWASIGTLQNGDPDGVCLVDGGGQVVEFLSYEGSFVAGDGPAEGLASFDIGVVETSGTPEGSSLQLTGSGTSAGEFSWTGPSPGSPGFLNAGQSLGGSSDPAFVRGDCSADGIVQLNDALVLLAHLFTSGPVVCLEACDMIDDGLLMLNDPVGLLGYLFNSGPAPAAPFPSCDTDDLVLGCDDFPGCP